MYSSHSFSTAALDGGEWSYPCAFLEKRSAGIKVRNKEKFRYGIPAYSYRPISSTSPHRSFSVFVHSTSSRLISITQTFQLISLLLCYISGFTASYGEDGGSTHQRDYTALYHRRLSFSCSKPWESQISHGKCKLFVTVCPLLSFWTDWLIFTKFSMSVGGNQDLIG
jgi:hypothetical protein